MAKFYRVEKEINGVNYTFQFNGISAALKAIDDSYIDGSSNLSLEKLNEYLLENVVVEPKCSIDDFEDVATLNKVTTYARKVMQGEIKPTVEKEEKKEKAK